MAEIHHPDGRIEHPDVRFEPSDASFGWIVTIMVCTVVVGFVIFFVVFQFFAGYDNHLAEVNRSPYPLAPGPSTALPREPRLEQIDRLSEDDRSKIYEHAAAKLRALNSYGPAEQEGYIHIPIERAMQMVSKIGALKSRAEPPADWRRRSGGLVDAGESNSGRMFKETLK